MNLKYKVGVVVAQKIGQNYIGAYFTPDCKLKIGNYQQSGIVHYVTKDFLTNNIIKTYEEKIVNG